MAGQHAEGGVVECSSNAAHLGTHRAASNNLLTKEMVIYQSVKLPALFKQWAKPAEVGPPLRQQGSSLCLAQLNRLLQQAPGPFEAE